MKSLATPRVGKVFAAVAVCASLGTGVAQAATSFPLTATISIQETVGGPSVVPPCFLLGTIVGTGRATHLGNVTLHAVDCINPDTTGTVLSFTSDHVVLTAANGDQVFATYSGAFQPAVGLITGGFQIVGGTGRFTHATGAGSLEGVENAAHQGHIELTGTISY